MKLKEIKVVIEGITPLMMDRYTEESQMRTEAGTSKVAVGDRGLPREQAEPKVYRNSKGHPVIPGPNIFACLIEGGKFHKVGKKQVTTGRSSLIPAGIAVREIETVVLDHEEKPARWEVDSRAIVNPVTRGRRLAHRPRFDSWRISFTLDVDVAMFEPKFVRQLVDDAGLRVGLGVFRPDRKGPFGKFKVILWEAGA